ncbi:MAG: MgtC/SapB family protein [Bacillota bacterium]
MDYRFIMPLLLSVIAGSLIGYLNQYGKGTGGARTFALICIGATLVTLVSKYFFVTLGRPWFADPGRLSAQIIPTLVFLALFILWFTEGRAEMISVGVNMWLAALIGMILGSGFGIRAAIAIGFVLLVLPIIDKAENRIRARLADQDRPIKKVES